MFAYFSSLFPVIELHLKIHRILFLSPSEAIHFDFSSLVRFVANCKTAVSSGVIIFFSYLSHLFSNSNPIELFHPDLGQIKLDVITKTPTGLEFTCAGLSNRETGRVLGHLESKHNVKEWGLTFKEKWTTDNQISTEITVADKMMEGLKLGAVGSFTPQAGKKRGTVSACMKGGYFNVGSEVELDQNGPLINATGVVG